MKMNRISIFNNLKSDRDYRTTTGLTKDEFDELSEKFVHYYPPTVLVGFPQGFGNNSIFQNPSEALFFLLYHHKVAVTYDVLALSFGIGRATAHNAITQLKPILKSILSDKNALPKRLFFSFLKAGLMLGRSNFSLFVLSNNYLRVQCWRLFCQIIPPKKLSV
jgi:hypothetical protein